MDQPTTDLARNATIHDLVAACNAAAATIRASFVAIVEAERAINAAFSITETWSTISIKACSSLTCEFDHPDLAIARLERKCWRVIVDRLELRRIMSVRRWEALANALERDKLPPITIANVELFARSHMDSIAEMHDEAITEVFNWLRPPYSRHKTNSKFEIGERVVIASMVRTEYGGGFGISYGYSSQRLQALENVLNALDGKGMTSKHHYSEVQISVQESKTSEGETPLFEWKAFKNGNLHLRFKRLDLLDKLNRKMGGLNLKP